MAGSEGTTLPGWKPSPGKRCDLCRTIPPGPGGILCPGCRAMIEAANAAGPGRGQDPPEATAEQDAGESP